MANTLTLGSVTITLPEGFNFEPVRLETNERTLDGSLITNYSVSSGDVIVTKHHFNLSGVATFPSTFIGSTGASCTLNALGSTYTVHLFSESYELLYSPSTGYNIMRYNLVLEEV